MQIRHPEVVQKIKNAFAKHGMYNLYVSTCDAAECTALPQKRARIWFVGILKHIDVGNQFKFPEPLAQTGITPLKFVLDPREDHN